MTRDDWPFDDGEMDEIIWEAVLVLKKRTRDTRNEEWSAEDLDRAIRRIANERLAELGEDVPAGHLRCRINFKEAWGCGAVLPEADFALIVRKDGSRQRYSHCRSCQELQRRTMKRDHAGEWALRSARKRRRDLEPVYLAHGIPVDPVIDIPVLDPKDRLDPARPWNGTCSGPDILWTTDDPGYHRARFGAPNLYDPYHPITSGYYLISGCSPVSGCTH